MGWDGAEVTFLPRYAATVAAARMSLQRTLDHGLMCNHDSDTACPESLCGAIP